MPAGPSYAVELRNRELVGADYFAALRTANARHCYSVHPRMPSIAEQRSLAGADDTGPLTVRWMLHAGLGYEQALSRYEPFTKLIDEDPENRAELADLCLERALAPNSRRRGPARGDRSLSRCLEPCRPGHRRARCRAA